MTARSPGSRNRLRILVSGMIAGVPGQGGAAWAVLQYVLGFRRLGHEVRFVETIQQGAVLPHGASLAASQNARYFDRVVREFGLQGEAALLDGEGLQTVGLPHSELVRFASSADVLINLSGQLRRPELVEPIPRRVYLDIDPAFTQLWQAVEGVDMGFSRHNVFVTIGMNIGGSECAVPTCGLSWIHTPQPIVLDHWPPVPPPVSDGSGPLTTIANWRAYGSVHHDGIFYGQKAHSLRRFIALPTLCPRRFVLALAIHPDERRDIESLAAHGWELVDPGAVADDPDAYRRFVQGSVAEFGIAKSGYVESNCGWFSDRSLCYLASGRPVLAQETGFSRWLPVGEGVLSFSTPDEAVAAVETMARDYLGHCRAARAIAERTFGSDQVLTTLLDRIGVPL